MVKARRTPVFKIYEYYLDKFEAASAAYGRRLLDVIDVHWYPETTEIYARIVYTIMTMTARIKQIIP